MPSPLFYLKVVQNKMVETGVQQPITLHILYHQSKQIAVDFTADLPETPRWLGYRSMDLLPNPRALEKLMKDGAPGQPKTGELGPLEYIMDVEYRSLEGEQYAAITETMEELQKAKAAADLYATTLREQLLAVGMIPPPPENKEQKESINPSTLSHSKKKRLERLVKRMYWARSRARMYATLGNGKKAALCIEEEILGAETDHNPGKIEEILRLHQGHISSERRRELLQKMYDGAAALKDYELQLQAAQELRLNSNAIADIQEKLLYKHFTTSRYLREDDRMMIKRMVREMSLDKVKSVAVQVYTLFMQQDKYDDCLWLAEHFDLGKERVCAVVHLIAGSKEIPSKKSIDLMAKAVGSSHTTVRSLAARRIIDDLKRDHEFEEEFSQRYALHRYRKVQRAVEKKYACYLEVGLFQEALQLRRHFRISDQKTSQADLETMVGIQNFMKRPIHK